MNLCEVVPCHHDDASCFDASGISLNKSVGDFPWYMFSEAAVLPESLTVDLKLPRNKDFEKRQWGHMHEAKLNIPLIVPSPLLPQSSVHKGHGIFREFQYLTFVNRYV